MIDFSRRNSFLYRYSKDDKKKSDDNEQMRKDVIDFVERRTTKLISIREVNFFDIEVKTNRETTIVRIVIKAIYFR